MLSARIRLCTLMLMASALGLAAATPNDTPTLDDVLSRAGRYVVGYVKDMSVVVSTEHYSQWVENALFFLQPSSQPRFAFKKTGEDKVGDVPVWKVAFAERQYPTIIRTRQGKDMPVKGTAWIDSTDGRVLKTNMQIVTDARIDRASPWLTTLLNHATAV